MDADTKVIDIINNPVFEGYGRFLFPTESGMPDADMKLGEIGPLMPFHENINCDTSVKVINFMFNKAKSGEKIFYNIYSDEEKKADPTKDNTGVFFFHGKPGAPFAIICAGGGFRYVGSIHESFPHAIELSEMGYNAFTIQYRSAAEWPVGSSGVAGADIACEDLAAAISFIFRNAKSLLVDTNNYSVWGASAGARMAAYLGSYGAQAYGGDDLPKPKVVVMQYTSHSDYTKNDPPTFGIIGEIDSIADPKTMLWRINELAKIGVDTEFHMIPDLGHGFGLGIGTNAEGWLKDAVAFWEKHNQQVNEQI